MFLPTLLWTIFLHRAMPDQRRWYDRLDNRVIIGALPLKRQIDALSRVERVTGVLNFCDEFAGHREYEGAGIRQLRLPVLDYCSPTAQQLENGPGSAGAVRVHPGGAALTGRARRPQPLRRLPPERHRHRPKALVEAAVRARDAPTQSATHATAAAAASGGRGARAAGRVGARSVAVAAAGALIVRWEVQLAAPSSTGSTVL